jgi:hypothetical protein
VIAVLRGSGMNPTLTYHNKEPPPSLFMAHLADITTFANARFTLPSAISQTSSMVDSCSNLL